MGEYLHDGIYYGLTQDSARSHQTFFPEALVDNIVRSWTFAALEQILRETSTSSLPFTRYLHNQSTGSSGKSLLFGGQGKEQKLRVAEQKSMIHPSRSSSLSRVRSAGDPPYAQPTASGQVVFENGKYHDRPAPTQDNSMQQTKNGLQELAGRRAQLIAIQRRLLEHIGTALGWNIGWAAILSSLSNAEELNDVDLDEDREDEQTDNGEKRLAATPPTLGIHADALVSAVSSVVQFRQSYEVSTDSENQEGMLTISRR
jgi:hypothetical protein